MAIRLAIKEAWVCFITSIQINHVFHPQVIWFSSDFTASRIISYMWGGVSVEENLGGNLRLLLFSSCK